MEVPEARSRGPAERSPENEAESSPESAREAGRSRRLACEGVQGQMHCWVDSMPAFPGSRLSLGYPESIGDAARPVWFGGLEPKWERLADGAWRSVGRREGELSYAMTVTPGEDFIDIRYRLVNESDRPWAQSLAFNCVQCGMIPEIRDHECLRTWVRSEGKFRRLVEIPRRFGPRPTIQLYSVEGAPRGAEIPFVANFGATPDVVVEGWIAVTSRDRKKLVATVARPALFLFQNMEYGCIHSGTGFGALAPGEAGEGRSLVYAAEGSIEAWYERMRRDIG